MVARLAVMQGRLRGDLPVRVSTKKVPGGAGFRRAPGPMIRSTCSYPGERDVYGYGSKSSASRKHFVTIRNRGGRGSALRLAEVHGRPVLGRHPEHDHAVGGVRRDVGVAAFEAQVAAREFQSLVGADLLDRHRALDGDVSVGRALVLRAQAEPARRADGG